MRPSRLWIQGEGKLGIQTVFLNTCKENSIPFVFSPSTNVLIDPATFLGLRGASVSLDVGTEVITVSITLKQIAGIWIDDIGPENTVIANALAAQGVDITDNSFGNRRIRILIQATGDPSITNFQLEFRKVGDTDWEIIK